MCVHRNNITVNEGQHVLSVLTLYSGKRYIQYAVNNVVLCPN